MSRHVLTSHWIPLAHIDMFNIYFFHGPFSGPGEMVFGSIPLVCFLHSLDTLLPAPHLELVGNQTPKTHSLVPVAGNALWKSFLHVQDDILCLLEACEPPREQTNNSSTKATISICENKPSKHIYKNDKHRRRMAKAGPLRPRHKNQELWKASRPPAVSRMSSSTV